MEKTQMKQFMDRNFLLESGTAEKLYFDHAAKMPIIDYHCHLSPKEIAEDKTYTNITEVWLYGDHYKWRAMRSCGVDEKYITGDGSDYEKFRAWCRIMPRLAGNPLYHWSHLELRRYFDCDLIICEENCDKIWQLTSEKLCSGTISARRLIEGSNVKLLCTTDDPADDLAYHKEIAQSGFSVRVLPAWRPDKSMNIERKDFCEYLEKLGKANGGLKIQTLDNLQDALLRAMDRFEALGCRTADHGIDQYVPFEKPHSFQADQILKKAIASGGYDLTDDEVALFKTQMMRFFCGEYKKRGWIMQCHFGVLRNPNKTMFEKLGPDTGYDMIYGDSRVNNMALLLNYLEENGILPRTILYSINPGENAAIGTLCGSFCRGDGSGQPTVTQGSAWWFNDNIDGMYAQLQSYANLAGLGNFMGMLTDSRSFLSYPRHEYFRRILCNLLGTWVEDGRLPYDEKTLGGIVEDICFNNTNRYFNFGV